MELALMRFKGFTLWCNPLSLEITSENTTADYNLIYAGQQYESTGKKCRVVKGKGVLSGKDCIEQYAKLYSLQTEGCKGVLSLPVTKPFEALFTKLTVLADTTPDTINYSFQFTEVSSEKPGMAETVHKVTKGETLFDIAFCYGVTVDALVKLNPQVCRPDELDMIKEIKVC